jgi:hypothetical protein
MAANSVVRDIIDLLELQPRPSADEDEDGAIPYPSADKILL